MVSRGVSGTHARADARLAGDFDYEEAVRRLRERNDLPIGVALMVQSAIAGIGNVYKSETLFLCQMNPFALVKEISDQDLKRLLARARELMKANLRGFPRTTRHALDGQCLWVYRRSRRPCRRCGTLIQMRRPVDDGRSTYWCAQCQSLHVRINGGRK